MYKCMYSFFVIFPFLSYSSDDNRLLREFEKQEEDTLSEDGREYLDDMELLFGCNSRNEILVAHRSSKPTTIQMGAAAALSAPILYKVAKFFFHKIYPPVVKEQETPTPRAATHLLTPGELTQTPQMPALCCADLNMPSAREYVQTQEQLLKARENAFLMEMSRKEKALAEEKKRIESLLKEKEKECTTAIGNVMLKQALIDKRYEDALFCVQRFSVDQLKMLADAEAVDNKSNYFRLLYAKAVENGSESSNNSCNQSGDYPRIIDLLSKDSFK